MNKDQVFEMANMVLPDGTKLDLFQAIVDGQKKIDVRARTPKYQAVEIGEVIIFQRLTDGQTAKRKVIMISEALPHSYPYVFSDLIFQVVKDLGLMPKNGLDSGERACSLIIPGIKSIVELTDLILNFPDYEKKVRQYGLIAFALGEVKNE